METKDFVIIALLILVVFVFTRPLRIFLWHEWQRKKRIEQNFKRHNKNKIQP